MLRTRWQKVLIDLWKNRARTLIVALAIAVGVYAVGVVLNTREMVVREYRSDQDGARMASAVLYTYPFEDELAERISEMPGVAAAEGRKVVDTRVYKGSGANRRLVADLVLMAVPSFDDMQVDALTPLEGQWPPGKREVILERLALDYLDVQVGQTLQVELEDGTQKLLTVVGTAHDPQALSPNVTNSARGYVAPETMVSLGLGHTYDQMRIRVSEQASNQAHIEAVADQVEDQLERTGRPVLARRVITESIADPFIDTIVLILSSFGVIILLLSGFLVVNAISALISQQVPQIGVMKLIGARRSQVMSLYMVTVLVYGAIAIVLGIPLAVLTSQLLMNLFVSDILNVLIDSLAVPPFIIVIQAAVGLLLPLLAGLVPVINGTRITTHRALNDVGAQAGGYGRGLVERILGRLQTLFSLQRPLLLAIRNTLRHKGRLVQTLVVLVIGSALFIAVVSVWNSVNATVEDFMRNHQYDVSIRFERPYRIARLEQIADQLPGVVDVEGWSAGTATWLRPDGTESEGMRIYGVPPESPLMAPRVTEGSWLPEDGHNALVVNSDVLDKEPGMAVGAEVVLELDGRERAWHVVGVVPTESQGPALYVAHEDYAYAARTSDQVTQLQVVTQRHDAAWQEKMEGSLLAHFEAYGIEVSGTETTQVMRSENRLIFTIVVAFLVLMAVLLAAVGGLGLTTTMSINILERVREIGVLRAVGASNGSVRRIVLAEGVAIGALSWGVGVLLSLPISRFMSEQLGLALIKVPLSYQYSLIAAVGWFFVLQVVAVLASLGPARNAVRLTIREVLAYE
jgi:putative ABC transport system permease protein